MVTIKIAKGWFETAGDKFDWCRDGHDIRGVGIRWGVLTTNEKLKVVVEGVTYGVRCKEAVEFVKKYKSGYTQKSTQIAVISKSILITLPIKKEPSQKPLLEVK